MLEFLKTKRRKALEVIGPFLAKEASRVHEGLPPFCEHCGRKTTLGFSPRYDRLSGKVNSWKFDVICRNHDDTEIYMSDKRIFLYHMEEHLPPEDFEKVLAAIEVLC